MPLVKTFRRFYCFVFTNSNISPPIFRALLTKSDALSLFSSSLTKSIDKLCRKESADATQFSTFIACPHLV